MIREDRKRATNETWNCVLDTKMEFAGRSSGYFAVSSTIVVVMPINSEFL